MIKSTKTVQLCDFINDQVQKLVISSFVYEWEWLDRYLKDVKKVITVLHTRELVGSFQVSPNRLLIVPPLEQWGCMHVKFLLIFYEAKIRVVITSANLIRIDWQVLENSVFYEDFPLYNENSTNENNIKENEFEKDLKKILKDMGIPSDVIKQVEKFDFKSAQGKLVFSKPGKYSGQDYGMRRLSSIIHDLSTSVKDLQREIYYQTSSLGSTSEAWIRDFYNSCLGLEPHSLINKKRKRGEREDLPPLRILFPSQDTVKFSTCKEVASSICFNRKYWKNFPKQVIRHCHSLTGSLMHSKIILSLAEKDFISGKVYIRDSKEKSDSWIYIGSHNCTLSAWGSITKNQDLYMRNWELGIIFGVSDVINDQEYKVPFIFPPKTYLPDQEPWVRVYY
jgi:tyrosyl-DNA phosphodiesterase-1